jgi:hypothetical protein
MLNFPKSTLLGTRIVKQKFYEKLPVDAEIKRLFVEQVADITWQHKFASHTLNIDAGERISEIEVLVISLKGKELDIRLLELMDREIPYHILFLLHKEGLYQAWIGYKEAAHKTAYKVAAYYHSDWFVPANLKLPLQGLNMDALYDSLVRQIAGDSLKTAATESLKTSIARAFEREKLEKQKAALTKKLRAEKQFNRQIKIASQLKGVEKILESLS